MMFATQNLAVLYIEQNPEVRKRVTQLMNENELRVFESENTSSGCDLFRMNEIDIVMIDLELPEKSGLNFIRCLREKDIQTPVIITTDHSDQETLLEAINLEITRYLIKPCKKHDLLDALQMAIKKAVNCHPLTFTKLNNEFSYDPINKTVNHLSGTVNQLSKKEYLLIELLLKNRHQIVPYDLIEMLVWEGSMMSMDALRTLVRGIRKKIYTEVITNYNGIGYKIDT
ncbi:MAG: response regulator [Ignavibacteria bacterium]|nr:response regulator [Ignavibacteria bacterium]